MWELLREQIRKACVSILVRVLRVAATDSADFCLRRGRLEHYLGNLSRAKSDYDRAIELDCSLSEAYYRRGEIHLFHDRPADALRDLSSSLELTPDQTLGYFSRGTAYFRLGRYDEAIDDYTRVLESDSANSETYLYRAQSLSRVGRYEEAESDFNEVIKRKYNLEEAFYGRALARFYLRRYAEAVEDCDSAARLDEKDVAVLVTRGLALQRLGKDADAESTLRRALEIDPDYDPAKGSISWLYATSPDATMHSPEKAQTSLSLAIEIQQARGCFSEAEKLRMLAAAHAENGRFAEAVEVQQQALEKEPGERTQQQLKCYQANQPYRESPEKM